MPAKKQVTKEMILGAALRVLMEGGTEAVNVKALPQNWDALPSRFICRLTIWMHCAKN